MTESPRRRAVDVLLPQVGGLGGIPQYNRQLLKALGLACDELDLEPRVFSLNDANVTGGRGFGRDKGRFVSAVVGGAVARRPHSVIIGHVNLAPLALVYRLLGVRRVYLLAHLIEIERKLGVVSRLAIRLCSSVLCISDATRLAVVTHQGVRPERTRLLQYAFEPSAPRTASEFGDLVDRPLRLLSVARMESSEGYKGIDTTLEAVALLKASGVDLEYTVVGDGDDRRRLGRLCVNLGLQDSVRFLGAVSYEVLGREYGSCDVFVLPSSREGLGIVYLEAMSYGKPVVALHAGGVADVVVHETNGLLVSEQTAEAVGAAIGRLAKDASLRARLGERATAGLARFSLAASTVSLRDALGGCAVRRGRWRASNVPPEHGCPIPEVAG